MVAADLELARRERLLHDAGAGAGERVREARSADRTPGSRNGAGGDRP